MATVCKAIVELSKARRALAAASSFDDVLAIRDKAVAAKAYAQAAQMSLEAMNEAVAVKLLAERKAGEMLAEAGLSKGRKCNAPLHLDDIGVNRMQSSRWQRLATIPEDAFEQFIADAKEARRELTTAAALRLAAGPAPEAQERPPRGLGDCIAALRCFLGELLDEWPDDACVFVKMLRDEADAIEART